MRTDPTFWILARASGLTAYLLVVCSMLAGLVLKSRPFGKLVRPSAVTDVHRSLALLALLAVGLHGLALLEDTSVPLTLLDLVVPGRASYRPVWTGAGVAAAEISVAIYLSFPLRKRLGTRAWRRLHWLTYAVFAAATAHGLLGGSDSGASWARLLYVGSLGAVVFATTWRAVVRQPARARSSAQKPSISSAVL